MQRRLRSTLPKAKEQNYFKAEGQNFKEEGRVRSKSTLFFPCDLEIMGQKILIDPHIGHHDKTEELSLAMQKP